MRKKNTKKNAIKSVLPLLPLRDIVVFPDMVVPLLVGRSRSIRALQEAMSGDKMIFLATQKDLHIDEPHENDIYAIGTVAEIIQNIKLPDGSVKLLVDGKARAKTKRFIDRETFYKVRIEKIDSHCKRSIEMEALMRSIKSEFEDYVTLNPKLSADILSAVIGIDSPVKLANIIPSHLALKISDKQGLLEIADHTERLKAIARILNSEIEILKVEKKIMSNIKRQIEKSQKDYFLTEQLKAIEKELGGKDSVKSEIEELEAKISKAGMTKEAMEIAERELGRLSKMPPISPEATVIRNYIDWMVHLPWSEKSTDNLDVSNAKRILNEDHYGLDKPKERILEYLAVRKLSGSPKGEIFCLVGPPGVGKTSLARSIARALGRKFVRVSLGGVRDEAEIRGHRRTYIGALPGRIIQSIRKAKSKNPVFLLDEIDKMSMDFRGDPTSALLEVLDPEENKLFSDHYLEVNFDLSEVMFITTSNVQYNIPFPLLDRMEIINMPGYTEYEKLNIARSFLLPKQIKKHGLSELNIGFSDKAIFNIIKQYTREAGVRDMERRIAEICRKIAREVVENGKALKIEVTLKNVHRYLGAPKYMDSGRNKHDEVGVATGLAWTEAGGDIMNIETSMVRGKGSLILTGKLGDVMQESAKASLTYIKSRSKQLGIKNGKSSNDLDIHIHVPEGSIPKDGPSAGITMATALVSNFTKRPVKGNIAMTGEITLRGRVLPVGGIKSKFLAAHRAGIDSIIYPKENKKDLSEIPKNILKKLHLYPVENMDEVLKVALKK
ncbi:MAG: endopeptidase La [Candidatus Omnitrophica bacterium]|nr:endopeptidase La [Candidatus Omnitrophota bacterium]